MFAVLGVGEAAARAIGFAGTVYVARRLGADAYGVVAVAAAIVLYFTYVADLAQELIGAREVAARPAAVEQLVPALVTARLAAALACIVVLGVFGLVILPQPDGAMLATTALTLLTVACSTRFVFLGLQRPAGVAIARICTEAVSVGLLLLLVHDVGDMARVPLARVAGDGIAAVLLVVLLRRAGFRLPVRWDPPLVRPIVISAAPLVAHAMLGLAIFNSDLIFLKSLHDAQMAGAYAAAYTIVSFMLNLGITYGNRLLPGFTRLLADPAKVRALYDSAMTQLFAAALPIAAGGCLLAGGLMETVFGPAYAGAVPALQVLIWSVVAAYIRTVVTFALIAHHQQSFVLRITAWSAVANLVLNVLLISRYGMIGAASATLATEVFRTIVALGYAARLGMPFGAITRVWRPIVATGAMALSLQILPVESVVLAVLGGGLVYAIALAMVGGIRMSDGRPALTV